jgi:hypothetical protein
MQEIYKGPGSDVDTAPIEKAIVVVNYGPLEQAVAFGWMTEAQALQALAQIDAAVEA